MAGAGVSGRDQQGAWSRWRDFARKAAVAQSNVLLGLLYYVVFVPLAVVVRLTGDPLERRHAGRWRERRATPQDLEAARRQF